MRAIAFHLALDVKKGLGKIDPSTDPSDLEGSGNPAPGAFLRTESDALQDCLSRLTEHQLIIFFAKHLEGMKGPEVAEEVGVAVGTVHATLHQVAKKLRRCLEGHGIAQGLLH